MPSADAIVAGYLRAFDPDWIVSLVGGYVPAVMSERLALTGEHGIRAGPGQAAATDVLPLLEYLHHTRFRFRERRPPEIAAHKPDGQMGLLGDAVLGRLSTTAAMGRVREKLVADLDAQELELSPELVARAQLEITNRAPLIPALNLEWPEFLYRRRSGRRPLVYLCSERRAWDAIEFWNLRAAGLDVVAVPLRWLERLAQMLAALLSEDEAALIAGRQLSPREHALAAQLAAETEATLTEPPRLGGGGGDFTDRVDAVVADTAHPQCPVSDGTFEVPPLNPPWAEAPWARFTDGWINEIEINDYSLGGSELAGVLPHDLTDVRVTQSSPIQLRPLRLRRGKFVTTLSRPGSALTLEVPTGRRAFELWLAEKGLRSRISDPGRVLLEISRRLEAAVHLPRVFGPETLKMLDRGGRRVALPQQAVRAALQRDGHQRDYALGILTAAGALQAGLLLACPRCEQTNWIPPEALDQLLRCERCLENFSFPHHRPPTRWGYRTAGPFAAPGFAAGAMPALAAVRALTNPTSHETTWSPSIEIEGVGEIDFALWRRSRYLLLRGEEAPELLLGEAKSYDEFAPRDVARLVKLREHLGEGTLCFVTLRERLTAPERRLLRAASAELRPEAGPAPIIVFTARELFAPDLKTALEETPRGARVLARYGFGEDTGAAALSEVTQALYLRR